MFVGTFINSLMGVCCCWWLVAISCTCYCSFSLLFAFSHVLHCYCCCFFTFALAELNRSSPLYTTVSTIPLGVCVYECMCSRSYLCALTCFSLFVFTQFYPVLMCFIAFLKFLFYVIFFFCLKRASKLRLTLFLANFLCCALPCY